MKKTKITIIACSLLMAILCLSGCGKEKPVDYSKGPQIMSLDEIYSSGKYGFYIKMGEDKFAPVIPLEKQENAQYGSYKWYAGHIKFPVVDEKHPLVAVYDVGEDTPEEFLVDRYDYITDTIGANVSVSPDNQSLYINSQNLLENSNAASLLADMGDDIELDAIAGSDKKKIRPISNVDREINILTGLKKDKYYTFTVYSGTRSLSADICADTTVLKYRDTKNANIKKTHQQYFIVNLPINLESGYYDINELGMFEVK